MSNVRQPSDEPLTPQEIQTMDDVRDAMARPRSKDDLLDEARQFIDERQAGHSLVKQLADAVERLTAERNSLRASHDNTGIDPDIEDLLRMRFDGRVPRLEELAEAYLKAAQESQEAQQLAVRQGSEVRRLRLQLESAASMSNNR